eukprot:1065687-Amorphochlora_amoeboformis.AAC.1
MEKNSKGSKLVKLYAGLKIAPNPMCIGYCRSDDPVQIGRNNPCDSNPHTEGPSGLSRRPSQKECPGDVPGSTGILGKNSGTTLDQHPETSQRLWGHPMPLNGLDDRKNAKRFLHRIVDETCGQEVDWSEDEDLGLIADLKSVFKKTVGQDQKTSEVTGFREKNGEMTSAVEELKGDGCSEASQKAFEAVLEGRRSDIKKALVESASQIFPSYLKDFDWSLKVGILFWRKLDI